MNQMRDALERAGVVRTTNWDKIEAGVPVDKLAASGLGHGNASEATARPDGEPISSGDPMLDGLIAERDELLARKDAQAIELGDIKTQIGDAKTLAFKGHYSDPGWFRKLEERARELGQQDQRIQHRLARLRAAIIEQRKRVNQQAPGDAAEPIQLLLAALDQIQRAVTLLRNR